MKDMKKEDTKYREMLAKYIIVLITLAIVAGICWQFRKILLYIVLAAVMALIAHPLFTLYKKPHIKQHHLPDWAASALSIISVFALVILLVNNVVPVIGSVINDISKANIENISKAVSVPLAEFNKNLVRNFPKLGYGFKIESFVLDEMKQILSVGAFSSMIGSVASFLVSLGVALFAVIFISFFFIKKPGLVSEIIIAMVPSKFEDQVRKSLAEIGTLVSRYFVGLVVEVIGVSTLNFLGLFLIARMGFRYSIGIAFLTGILNVVPYVGPLIGGVIGVSLSLIIKYVCATSFGLSVGFLPFVAVLLGVFVFTQLVDNYVFQPYIYSNSVQVHPLEIFIVFLIAGQISGMVGMLAAIPAYTVARVIAKEFFGYIKPVRILTQKDDQDLL